MLELVYWSNEQLLKQNIENSNIRVLFHLYLLTNIAFRL